MYTQHVSTTLAQHGSELTEIERRFLVDIDTLPQAVRDVPGTGLRQGYLAVEEGWAAVRIRRRAGVDGAILTVKSGAGLTRHEVEVDISETAAEKLWPETDGRRVEKSRAILPLEDGNTAELDRFMGSLAGHAIVEVEFMSEDEARAFTPPAWFGREVTEDGRYNNSSLARFGWPSEDGEKV